jgi:hypothetical protein
MEATDYPDELRVVMARVILANRRTKEEVSS